MTMHYIKKANMSLQSERYFKFQVEYKHMICHCPFMMPTVTKETQKYCVLDMTSIYGAVKSKRTISNLE